MAAYDPYYAPEKKVLDTQYNTITCTYVLNVIEDPKEREEVLATLKRLLAPDGVAYITVRRDKETSRGHTTRGTFQGFIELDLPVIYNRAGQFITYALTKFQDTAA
jgi:ubiquinone/menaquinone biosynthesis C-methylase UbiE